MLPESDRLPVTAAVPEATAVIPLPLSAMETTEISLLDRVRDCADNEAWRAFDAKYRDLILRYCRARGLQPADAEDARQIVLLALARMLPKFCYQPRIGRFRSYLGAVVRSAAARVNDKRRPLQPLDLHDVECLIDGPYEDKLWEAHWVDHHYKLAMDRIRAESTARSLEIFEQLYRGQGVRAVAQQFGVSEQSVYKIQQRIRERLRQCIAKQIDDEERQ